MSRVASMNPDPIEPADSFSASRLLNVPESDLPAAVTRVLELPGVSDKAKVELCLATLESRGGVQSPLLEPFVGESSAWRHSAAGAALTARILDMLGRHDGALAAWDQALHQSVDPPAEAWLARARLWGRTGRRDEAFADLRRAIADRDDYTFLATASRVYERLRQKGAPAAARKTRIALLSSPTPDLAVALLRLACFRRGIDADWYVAPYDNVRQELLNPDSGLYAFKPEFVVVAVYGKDAHVSALSKEPDAEAARAADEWSALWRTLLDRQACRIIQHNFDVPADEAWGHLSGALAGGRAAVLRDVNRRLQQAAPPAVAILDVEQISAVFGKRAWFDPARWFTAKQYPAADALPLLAEHQASLMAAGLGLTKKVLVLDLDNTLWGGVIGEDGLGGIRLGPPSASGEAFAALHRYARELKARGILLAVCSKNNEADAQQPFLRHEACELKLEDFAAFFANWEDKPSNLRRMAQRLNLGLDSFVMLDDNPVERALIRREVPDVAVPEVGEDPYDFIRALERGLYFQAWALSAEDLDRHASYQANAQREALKDTSGSIDDFLRQLDMEAENGPIDEAVLARAVQLIGRTNQFNLVTRRHSEADVRRLMDDPACWTRWFRLKDRFGDNGLVGVLVARPALSDPTAWEIDTWLMSCRVIGRRLEPFMLRMLIEAARSRGVSRLLGLYSPTPKNAMVAGLYPSLGFVPDGDGAAGEKRFVFDVKSGALPECDCIRAKPVDKKVVTTQVFRIQNKICKDQPLKTARNIPPREAPVQ